MTNECIDVQTKKGAQEKAQGERVWLLVNVKNVAVRRRKIYMPARKRKASRNVPTNKRLYATVKAAAKESLQGIPKCICKCLAGS